MRLGGGEAEENTAILLSVFLGSKTSNTLSPFAVYDCVGQQVGDHKPQLVAIRFHCEVRRHLNVQRIVTLGGLRPDIPPTVLNQGSQQKTAPVGHLDARFHRESDRRRTTMRSIWFAISRVSSK